MPAASSLASSPRHGIYVCDLEEGLLLIEEEHLTEQIKAYHTVTQDIGEAAYFVVLPPEMRAAIKPVPLSVAYPELLSQRITSHRGAQEPERSA